MVFDSKKILRRNGTDFKLGFDKNNSLVNSPLLGELKLLVDLLHVHVTFGKVNGLLASGR